MAKVSNNEKCPYTDITRLSHNDIIANTAALQAGTYQIATIPAGGCIDLVTIARPENFTATNLITLSIGTTLGTPTELMAVVGIGAGVGAIAPRNNTGTLFVAPTAATTTYLGGALPVNATATPVPVYAKTSVALNAAESTGVVVIGLKIIDTAQYLS